MNKNIKKTFEVWGATYIVTLTGEPEALARTVNTYANFGMFEAPPADYSEKHNTVTISMVQKNVKRGLQALAEFQLAQDKEACAAMKGQMGHVFKTKATDLAREMWMEFERTSGKLVEMEGERALFDYEVPASENFPGMKAKGRKLLAAIAGEKRAIRMQGA